MRKKLGVKRHLKLIAVQNNSMQWESYIYQMKVRESDSKRVPMKGCLLYTSPSPRDRTRSRMPSSA